MAWLLCSTSKPSTGGSQLTDHFVAHTRWAWAGHRQCQTLACARVPPKRPQNKHTRWPASDHTRAPPNHLHKPPAQRADPQAPELTFLHGVSSCTRASAAAEAPLPADQPKGKSLLSPGPQQPRLRYNRMVHTTPGSGGTWCTWLR